MKRNLQSMLCLLICFAISFAQDDSQDLLPEEKLTEVEISSSRLEIPLSQNSHTIQIISADQIKQSGVTNVVDLLQQFAGIDIRRRGVGSAQADLYIRGGTFDQTLLLIDGIKMEDAQTGHHTLNFIPPPEVIQRIEIVKGPAARTFGQNAFTGAINIITKKEIAKSFSLGLQQGSYDQTNGNIMLGSSNEKTSVIVFGSKNTSDGYRYNTDYDQNHIFVKSTFFKHKTPLDLITSFSSRKFGGNGFYANPDAIDQYEETQASLIALSTRVNKGEWIFKPKIYWRRGQDMYEFVRGKPEIYRNLHITNKVGVAFDASLISDLGNIGMGFDVSRVAISSNNLGERERTLVNLFIEHRFYLLDKLIDITQGLAANYYSDFKWNAFPGIDLGLNLSPNFKLYSSLGFTYRVPTFTDLYYTDRTTTGNADLLPEEAFSKEVGMRLTQSSYSLSVAYFDRSSSNLIDYVKKTDTALWKAENIQRLDTQGIDFEFSTNFEFKAIKHHLKIGYSYLENSLRDITFDFSKYVINNALKHHWVTSYSTTIFEEITTALVYKYAERTGGNSYSVLDFNVQWNLKPFELSVSFNNILNEVYSETNLIPMPKGNGLFGVRYTF
jgi:iron complex outermembrane receptor protein